MRNLISPLLMITQLLVISCAADETKAPTRYAFPEEDAGSINSLAALCGDADDGSHCIRTVRLEEARASISMERKDHHWSDQEVLMACQSRSLEEQSTDIQVTDVAFADKVYGNDCYDRDWKNKCVRWKKKVSVTCIYSRVRLVGDVQ